MHGVEGESGDQAMLGLGGCQKVWLSSALVEVWWRSGGAGKYRLKIVT